MEVSIMPMEAHESGVSTKKLWIGRILSALAVLFLLFDAVIKLVKIPAVAQSFSQLGYPINLAVTIATLELVCVAVYVIPSTSVLGAILLTGYLGGAIASHVRVGNPLFSHVLFPVYIGALLWGGLFLRERRLGSLVPLRR
jgi:DoxX-like family